MEIVARKIGHHESFPNVGYIEPLFRVDSEGRMTQLDDNEIDQKIETHQYNEINSYFQKGALFRITVSSDISDRTGKKFIADGQNAVRLADSTVGFVFAELPDRNDKDIILPNDNFPGTKVIFLANGVGDCYGPLEWDIKDKENKIITIKKNSTHLENFKLPEEFIYKITFKDIFGFTVFNPEKGVCLIYELGKLGVYLQELKEYFDYSSDQELISFFTKKLTRRNTPINEITPQHLANSFGKHIYSKELLQHKIDLLKTISIDEDINFDNINKSFESFFLTEKGKKVLEDYVKNNKNNLESIISLEKDTEFSEQIKEKESKLQAIQSRIEQAKSELIAQQSSATTESINTIEPEILKELEDLRLKAAAFDSLEHMRWKKNSLNEDIENLQNKKTAATVEFSEIQRDISNLINDARARALDFKTFWDVYSKKDTIEYTPQDYSCEISNKISRFNENLLLGQQACIDFLHHKISKDGAYHISKLLLANLMLSTQQTFLTFLAGPPGVGKTSLIKQFCEKQNIKSRLLNVAVSRGWTSQRDFIGFYNPLNECFQVSNSGVFNFLVSIGKEKIDSNQPTAYILLDEANLSPIEHYWSSFMGQSDYKEKSINLGNQILDIPQNIRFVGTINYDETTEKLSPRILNRATIINIPTSISSEISILAEDLEELYPLSYKDAETLFGRVQTPSLKPLEEEGLKQVINILEARKHELGRPITVSHRKRESIYQYCHKGRNLLESYTDNPLTALDLAIKQNLLPLVSGYGYGLQKRLNELLEILDQLNLENSKSHLKEMLEFGNLEMNSYDFFSI